MNYILLIWMFGQPITQVGPFNALLACESAAGQVMVLGRVRTVCVALDPKPLHWKGKALPK